MLQHHNHSFLHNYSISLIFLLPCVMLASSLRAGPLRKLPSLLKNSYNNDGSLSIEFLLPQGTKKTITITAPGKVPLKNLEMYRSAGVLPYFVVTSSANKKNVYVALYTPLPTGSYSDVSAYKATAEKVAAETAARAFISKQSGTWQTQANLETDLSNRNPMLMVSNHYLYLLPISSAQQIITNKNCIIVDLFDLIMTLKETQRSGIFAHVRIKANDGKSYLLLEKFVRGLSCSPDYVNKFEALILAENAAGSDQILQHMISGE